MKALKALGRDSWVGMGFYETQYIISLYFFSIFFIQWGDLPVWKMVGVAVE